MKRVFGMATIPSRYKTLDRVISSIYPFVDYGMVVFNSYKEIPEFMKKYPNIKCVLSPEGRLRDMAKFLLLKELKEDVYYFSCDDDFIYNKTYFNYLENKAETLNAIVTIHGRRFKRKQKSTNYYHRTISEELGWDRKRKRNIKVPFGGTGVMCFSTKIFKPENLEFIDKGVFSDIWFSIEAKKRRLFIYCVPSPKIQFIKYPVTIASHKNLDSYSKIDKINSLKLAAEEINFLFYGGNFKVYGKLSSNKKINHKINKINRITLKKTILSKLKSKRTVSIKCKSVKRKNNKFNSKRIKSGFKRIKKNISRGR